MEGMGEEKLYFPILKSVKYQKAPFWRSVLTDFVACCRFVTSFLGLLALILLLLLFMKEIENQPRLKNFTLSLSLTCNLYSSLFGDPLMSQGNKE